jgi:hypothetical protein
VESHFGGAVAASGDFNDDGFLDVLVTADLADVNHSGQLVRDAGELYIFFGPTFNPAAAVRLREPILANLPSNGPETEARFGFSVAAVADINGDGIDDMVVGASEASVNSGFAKAGEAFVLLGKKDLSQANPPNVIHLAEQEPEAGAKFGWAVAGAGDVDNDGRNDIVVGAPFASKVGGVIREGAGEIFVFSKFSTEPGKPPFRLHCVFGITPLAEFGYALAAAGDVDKDGFADIVVGSPNALTGSGRRGGHVTVFQFTVKDTLTTKDSKVIRSPQPADGERFGHAVACGDLDGDGNIDIIVGAPKANVTQQGQNFVGAGKVFLIPGPDFDENKGSILLSPSPQAGANFGAALASAGDLNRDGFEDFIVGSELANLDGQVDAGEAHVFFGRADIFSQPAISLESIALNQTDIRQEGANFGHAVAGVSCDLREKISDQTAPLLAVGAPFFEQSGTPASGQAFVFRLGAQLSCSLTLTAPGSTVVDDSVTVVGTVRLSGGRPPIKEACTVNGIAFAPASNGEFSVRVPLPIIGANEITAICNFIDADGQSTTCSQTVVVIRREHLACELEIISPAAGAVICADSVKVCAISAASAAVPPLSNRKGTINGIEATFSGDTLCAVVPLVIGANGIKAIYEFVDSQQNRFICEDTISVQGCQPLTCTVDIISPAPGAQICDDSVDVTAVLDLSNPKLVKEKICTINGIAAHSSNDTLFATIPLTFGSNLIVASCVITDTLGNTKVCTDSVRIFGCDTLKVELTILTPTTGQQICADSAKVKALLTTTGGLPPLAKTGEVNGVPAIFKNDTLFATISLVAGANDITAIARITDGLGQAAVGRDTVQVTRCAPLRCQLTITSPNSGQQIATDSVVVTAVAVVTGGAVPVTSACNINGLPAQLNGNMLTAKVPLTPGPNRIIATCVFTDANGTQETCRDTVEVIRVIPGAIACQVNILSPLEGAVICGDSVTVTGVTNIIGGTPPFLISGHVNGVTALFNGNQFTTRVPCPLSDSLLIATCTVVDALGRQAVGIDTVRVICATAPIAKVVINSPEDGIKVCNDSVTVQGTTTVTGGAPPLIITCQVNGIAAVLTGNSFTVKVPVIFENNLLVAVCTVVDNCGVRVTSRDSVVVFRDGIPPTCSFGMRGTFITGTFFDKESGIAAIEPINVINATLTINSFTTGDREVDFRLDAIDTDEPMGFNIRVTDVCGNTFVCDPVMLHLFADGGSQQRAFKFPGADRYFRFTNHGLSEVRVDLNGNKFKLVADPNRAWSERNTYFTPEEGTVAIDMQPYLRSGENEMLIAFDGRLGTSAELALLDVAPVVDYVLDLQSLPVEFLLTQNYPNPFNPETTIRFDIPERMANGVTVQLRIYNVLGELVRTLVDEMKLPGQYGVQWDGKNDVGTPVSGGLYIYRLQAGDFSESRRMLMLK